MAHQQNEMKRFTSQDSHHEDQPSMHHEQGR